MVIIMSIKNLERSIKLFKTITEDLCQAEFESLMQRLRLEEFARDMEREKNEQDNKEDSEL